MFSYSFHCAITFYKQRFIGTVSESVLAKSLKQVSNVSSLYLSGQDTCKVIIEILKAILIYFVDLKSNFSLFSR